MVKGSLPPLKRFIEKKGRRKVGKVKVVLRRHGRIACYDPGRKVIYLSSRLTKKNPVLARAVLVHELAHCAGHNERQAYKFERLYLQKKGTSYRREVARYRRS